jgi:hypothetical protein
MSPAPWRQLVSEGRLLFGCRSFVIPKTVLVSVLVQFRHFAVSGGGAFGK